MTVWTVSSTDDVPGEPVANFTVGSYLSRGEALRQCADYILERAGCREDIRRALAHDENHPDFPKRGAKRQRGYLVDELGGQGCYYVCSGDLVFHFDVDENGVEGELWHTVTWGDSDTEDPEFTTPWPETFTSEEAAVKNFYRYALDLTWGRERKVPAGLKSFVYDALRKQGKCQVGLGDGRCVSCVLYHDDAKNVKE